MTKERINEIVKKEWPDTMNIEDLLYAVSTEARKEGIDEIRDALIKGPRMLHEEQKKWIDETAKQIRDKEVK